MHSNDNLREKQGEHQREKMIDTLQEHMFKFM